MDERRPHITKVTSKKHTSLHNMSYASKIETMSTLHRCRQTRQEAAELELTHRPII